MGIILMAVITAKSFICDKEVHPIDAPLKEMRGVLFLIKIQPKPCCICGNEDDVKLG